MAQWSLADAGRHSTGGLATSTNLTTVTSGSVANTLGSWALMFAAVPFHVSLISVFLGATGIFVSGQNSQTLLNVGMGPSGQEQIIVPNIAIGGNAQFATWHFPLNIPSGSRLVLQTRSIVASKAAPFGMTVFGGGFGLEAGHQATTYGAVTASTSRGTVITTPVSSNTKGAWTVISAATAAPARWLSAGLTAPDTATSAACNGYLDIGVGTAGQEAVVAADIPFRTSLAEDILAAFPIAVPVNLPAGVRLVARIQQSAVAAAAVPTITITGIC